MNNKLDTRQTKVVASGKDRKMPQPNVPTLWHWMTMAIGVMLTPVALAQDTWMLLSRESGCVSLQLLVKMERLPHAPASPEEFAAMMRARNHSVTMSLPDGFPREMSGQAVMVKYADNRAPVFVRPALCAHGKKS